MKGLLFCFLIQLSATLVFAQHYTPSDNGSKISFKIKNFGFSTDGSFKGLQGEIHFDPRDPGNSSFEVSVDASTVDTDNEMRDGHLRKEAYFDVQNYPRIRFVSTKVSASEKSGEFSLTGKLTIKNQTKEITFPFTATPSNGGYLFKGEFKINRKDFGVGGSSTVADNLTVILEVFAGKS